MMKLPLNYFLLALLGAGSASADVALPAFFSDHAVLQRDKPLPIWGTAETDEMVTVSFGAATKSATAAADGSWSVNLDAMPASAEPRSLNVSGSKSGKGAELKDVLVDELWFASGQSNMATSAGASAGVPDQRHPGVGQRAVGRAP